ncbi:alternative ribosome rescue aminoacyl-tRNA hydrolase ArfB [Sunxiuqinia dokdonensis]|uniref:Class I peptide chain release factor n=1 Tax=Sunxiuqinia dokdonensis TaxID=1409788 RepID=A0A0L8V7U1_9BACT|nr:alternative ribosome rescue aminoacyl-tRNA hydrolase ArfB [Sunxiuqinia dokdonensis]KOH44423.1 class I peptide chain release factor [Sunxiuqinia dokdonensis]
MNKTSVHIPDLSSEFSFRTSRSSGPGGQHVNKVDSRVELRFNIENSQLLTELQKKILQEKLESKLTTEGDLIVVSQKERSQLRNKEITIEKLYSLLAKALQPKKKRRPTKPTRTSVEKRITTKKQTGEKKKWRGKIDL